jgi:hypothetical protein
LSEQKAPQPAQDSQSWFECLTNFFITNDLKPNQFLADLMANAMLKTQGRSRLRC